jgi:hypothetical protein
VPRNAGCLRLAQQCLGIAPGHGQRLGRAIGGGHVQVGAGARHADRDRAAAGAQIENVRARAGLVDHEIDQLLGFGSRNEHGRADLEAMAVEFADAGQIASVLLRASAARALRSARAGRFDEVRP